MSKHGKKSVDAQRTFDREQLYAPHRGHRAREVDGHPQVRRDGRSGVPPRRRPPQGRPDDPRHRVAAARHRQERARAPCSPQGDAAREARGGGCRRRRLRRPHRADRGRLPRLRRRHRHPRPHGPGRQARPHPRAARPDAEPEDRHRHQRGRQDRRRVQGGQGRVPHRPLRQRARADRQGELRRHGAARELPRPCSTSCCGPSPRRPRAGTCKAVTTELDDGPGRARSTRAFTRIDEHARRRPRSTAHCSTTSSATDLRSLRGNGALRPTGRLRRTRRSRSDGTSRVSAASVPVRFSARGNTMARPEKVAVVDEIRTKLGGGRRDRAHRVPRADGPRAGRAARRRCARRAPSTRCSRTRWPAGRSRAAASTRSRRCSRARWRSRSCAATPPPRRRRCASSARTTRRWSSRAGCSASG